MYHRTLCADPSLNMTEKDRKEACSILTAMIKPGASTHYAPYEKYRELVEGCIQQIHEITHIQHYEIKNIEVPPYTEMDKTLLIKPKSKTIVDLFSKVKKNID
jgi:hypothetical protein